MYSYVSTGELPSIATTNREIYAYIYRLVLKHTCMHIN